MPPPAAFESIPFAMRLSTWRVNGMLVVLPPFAYGDAITMRALESWIA